MHVHAQPSAPVERIAPFAVHYTAPNSSRRRPGAGVGMRVRVIGAALGDVRELCVEWRRAYRRDRS